MTIGFVLRSWRLHEELSLKEAARMIGLPLSTLGRIEKGCHVEDKTKAALLQFLFESWGR
jgi:cytoskeletal protein RodZ